MRKKTIPIYNSRQWQLFGIRSNAEIIMLNTATINSLNQTALWSSGTSPPYTYFISYLLLRRLSCYISLLLSSSLSGCHPGLQASIAAYPHPETLSQEKWEWGKRKIAAVFVNKQWVCMRRAWFKNGSYGRGWMPQAPGKWFSRTAA